MKFMPMIAAAVLALAASFASPANACSFQVVGGWAYNGPDGEDPDFGPLESAEFGIVAGIGVGRG